MTPVLRRLAIAAIVLLLMAGLWAIWDATLGRPVGPPPEPPPPGRAGEVVPELVVVEPGSVVAEGPPRGWSHLVIKTITALESGDVGTMPGFARETATRFRTIVLADVRPEGSGHALHRVGVGLAVAQRGRDLVIASSSLDALNVSASLLDRLVLSRAEQALARGRLAARTSTFALYDASVELAEGDRHRSIYLRYALLVNLETGALDTFAWPVAEKPEERIPPTELIRLEPATRFFCGVHVLAERALGKVPVNWYFAMIDLPPGDRLPMPALLRDWSIRDPKSPEESAAMEEALRRSLGLDGPSPRWARPSDSAPSP